jgi:hypothetical protein
MLRSSKTGGSARLLAAAGQCPRTSAAESRQGRWCEPHDASSSITSTLRRVSLFEQRPGLVDVELRVVGLDRDEESIVGGPAEALGREHRVVVRGSRFRPSIPSTAPNAERRTVSSNMMGTIDGSVPGAPRACRRRWSDSRRRSSSASSRRRPTGPVRAQPRTIHPRRESLRPMALSMPCTGNGVCASHRTYPDS